MFVSMYQWYVRREGRIDGPFSAAQIREMALTGNISAVTEVRSSIGDWKRAAKLQGLVFGTRTAGVASGSQDAVDAADPKAYPPPPPIPEATSMELANEILNKSPPKPQSIWPNALGCIALVMLHFLLYACSPRYAQMADKLMHRNKPPAVEKK